MEDIERAGLDWMRLDQLNDADLALLVAAAVDVMEDAAGDQDRLSSLPIVVQEHELKSALQERGYVGDIEVSRMTEGDGVNREVALAVLADLRTSDGLAAEIESAYEARRRMMVEPVTLAVLALVALAVKLRSVKVGKSGTQIEFYDMSSGAFGRLVDLIKL